MGGTGDSEGKNGILPMMNNDLARSAAPQSAGTNRFAATRSP